MIRFLHQMETRKKIRALLARHRVSSSLMVRASG